MAPRHKQMCGCEDCVANKQNQLTLNAWRCHEIKNWLDDPNIDCTKKQHKTAVLPDGKNLHEKPEDALNLIMCERTVDNHVHNWGCVLGRCQNCPNFEINPVESAEVDADDTINFHNHVHVTQCS
jgi:hypothetical protein